MEDERGTVREPSTKDVQYHRMAPRLRAAQLVEDRAAVCPETGPRCLFIFFSPLSLLGHSSSFRLLFSRLVCPYPQVRRGRPDGLPPRGGGGSRAQSRGYCFIFIPVRNPKNLHITSQSSPSNKTVLKPLYYPLSGWR